MMVALLFRGATARPLYVGCHSSLHCGGFLHTGLLQKRGQVLDVSWHSYIPATSIRVPWPIERLCNFFWIYYMPLDSEKCQVKQLQEFLKSDHWL